MSSLTQRVFFPRKLFGKTELDILALDLSNLRKKEREREEGRSEFNKKAQGFLLVFGSICSRDTKRGFF